jgi:hypothetical protein
MGMLQQFHRNPRVELAPLDAEAILFDPHGNKFLVLNNTSSFLWDCLAEPCTASDLARAVCDRFDGVAFPDALRDVEQILGDMVSRDLLVEVTPAAS